MIEENWEVAAAAIRLWLGGKIGLNELRAVLRKLEIIRG